MTFMRKLLDVFNMENWYSEETADIHLKTQGDINGTPDIIVINNTKILEPEPILPTEYNESIDNLTIYKSDRMIIKGLNLFFVDIAREIVQNNCVNNIPLMREYNVDSSVLSEILQEMRLAKILDDNNRVLLDEEQFEKFIDIYEPSLFKCKHCYFDKDIFMCMGEIMFESGVDNTYACLSSDEVLDYLYIMEKLKFLKFSCYDNQYNILCTKQHFFEICEGIPNYYGSETFNEKDFISSDKNFDDMSGIEFESFCASILSKNGFSEIKITPSSGDHGIDILAEKNDISYAIQCKCYSSSIGNSAIQQANTGKMLYKKDIAVVLTNQYFTPQAIDEANALGVKLWDRNKLLELY